MQILQMQLSQNQEITEKPLIRTLMDSEHVKGFGRFL